MENFIWKLHFYRQTLIFLVFKIASFPDASVWGKLAILNTKNIKIWG